jgi:ribose transport system substrate-binding protein
VQVAVDSLNGKPVPKQALLKMLEVTSGNVDHYYDQLYVHPDDFLAGLPTLVRKNLVSGDYSFQ